MENYFFKEQKEKEYGWSEFLQAAATVILAGTILLVLRDHMELKLVIPAAIAAYVAVIVLLSKEKSEADPRKVFYKELKKALRKYFPEGMPADYKVCLDAELKTLHTLGYEDIRILKNIEERDRLDHYMDPAATGVLVRYLLGISTWDPVAHDRMFEKYLAIQVEEIM